MCPIIGGQGESSAGPVDKSGDRSWIFRFVGNAEIELPHFSIGRSKPVLVVMQDLDIAILPRPRGNGGLTVYLDLAAGEAGPRRKPGPLQASVYSALVLKERAGD